MPLPFLIGLLGTIGSAVVATAGAVVAASGVIAASTWAIITSAPVLATVVGIGGLATVGSMLEDAERDGRKAGYKDGYVKGGIDTARKFAESTEEHIAKVCGMYGLGIYMGVMDGPLDKDKMNAIVEVLGSRHTLEDYVNAELDKVLNMSEMSLEVIMKNYLNKVSADGIKDCDSAVKDFVSAYRSKGHDVSVFYNKIWKPYFNGRVQ